VAKALPVGVADGHHIQNRSDREAVLLDIGSKRPGEDTCRYPDNRVIVEPGLRVRPYGTVLDDCLGHEQNDALECKPILRAHLDGRIGDLR
jgi:uncharacterized cupin superfamily protein